MDKQELIEFYNKHKSNISRHYENSQEATEIRILTSFLDNSYDKIYYSQRIWHIINDCYELIKCPICNVVAAWNDKKIKYNKTCGNIDCYNSHQNSDGVKQQRRKTNLKRYGVDNPAKSDIIKKKEREISRQKYGVDYYYQSNDFKTKAKNTNTLKYGVTNYTKSNEYRRRYKSEILPKKVITNMKRYGVSNYSKTAKFKEKFRESYRKTCINRYGQSNYCHSSKYIKKVESNFKDILINGFYYNLGYRYIQYLKGRNHLIYCPHCNGNFILNSSNHFNRRQKSHQEICTNCNPLHKNYSCGEKDVLDYVSSIYSGTIIENTKKVIYPYELDIYLPDLKLAIEFNGDYWHANPDLYSKDEIINNKLASDIWEKDIKKINRCYSRDITLIVVWENDWINNREEIKSLISDIINILS